MKLFLTGTGTDVGKTFVGCALLRRVQGLRALKPVLSGYDPHQLDQSDPGLLLAAQGLSPNREAVEAIAPFRYAAPLSPDMAARAEGRVLDYPALLAFCRAADAPLLIEGVGGVMVPLTEDRTVLDWIVDLGAPVLLVAGSYLGALSHALTAIAVLRARGVAVVAVVVNETPGSTVDLAATEASIARHGRVRTLRLRRGPEPREAARLAVAVTSAWAGSR